MNKIYLSGRLTKDVDLKILQNEEGTYVVNFDIACSRYGLGGQDAEFIACVAYGKLADFINKYCGKKGQALLIQGSWKTIKWTDKTGASHTKTHCLVEQIEPLTFTKETGISNKNNEDEELDNLFTDDEVETNNNSNNEDDNFFDRDDDDLPF